MTQVSALTEEACLQSLFSTALFSGPGGRARHYFGLVSKNTTSQKRRLVRVSTAGPQTEEHGAHQIRK